MEVRLSESGFQSTYEFHKDRAAADHLNEDGHRHRLLTVADIIRALDPAPASLIDYGCGTGGLLSLLDAVPNRKGYDFSPHAVEFAQDLGRPVQLCNFVAELNLSHVDVAVMTEVLEHLDDPHGFLERLPCERLVASVPVNETARSHCEEHVWAWDRPGFAVMLEGAGFEVREHVADAMSQYVVAVRVVRL